MAESEVRVERRAMALVKSHRKLMQELIAYRDDHNLSQEEVAHRMGVSQPTVSSFERYDTNPTLATIRRYALAVGVEIDYVIKDDCEAHDDIFVAALDGWIRGTTSPRLLAAQDPEKRTRYGVSGEVFQNRTNLTYVSS